MSWQEAYDFIKTRSECERVTSREVGLELGIGVASTSNSLRTLRKTDYVCWCVGFRRCHYYWKKEKGMVGGRQEDLVDDRIIVDGVIQNE